MKRADDHALFEAARHPCRTMIVRFSHAHDRCRIANRIKSKT
jgi:hypothetical protein